MYWISRFRDVVLPNAAPSSDVGTGDSLNPIVQLPDGNRFDYWGSDQVPRTDTVIVHIGKIIGNTEAEATQKFRALRALRGKRGKLYRTLVTENGLETEWCWARCLPINATRERQFIRHQLVELQFAMLSPIWYGRRRGVWELDDGFYLDDGMFLDEDALVFNTSDDPFVLTNGGNATVKNTTMRLAVTSSSLINPIVTNTTTGIGVKYNGTLNTLDQVLFDFGAKSIKVNGVEAYEDFEQIGVSAHWFPLVPGENVITLAGTGNYLTEWAYSDGWE